MILKYGCSNVLISRQGARIQPQVYLQSTACLVQQSSNKHTIRKCCPSLFLILHLDGFLSVEDLLKCLGITPGMKKLGQRGNMPCCIRTCKLLHQTTPSLKTIRIIVLTNHKCSGINCQVGKQIMQYLTGSNTNCCCSSVE